MMTQKHFIAAAERVQEIPKDSRLNKTLMAEFLANWFAQENPKFKRERFLAACEGKQ